MGNYSKPDAKYYPGSTFDPDKNYVGVRLQQGVPLVDADWNELNDVTRQELYNGLGLALSSGIQQGPISDFAVLTLIAGLPAIGSNDFYVYPGKALVSGRPVNLPQNNSNVIRYTTQPWIDSARAVRDGVAVIPPLTTPSANRTDLVYLDTWEREVDSAEDKDHLINPSIGIETCVRLKREVAIRVFEGVTLPLDPTFTKSLPVAPAGHIFMPLALLNRFAGQAQIDLDQIRDIRPRVRSSGIYQVSFAPLFQGSNPNQIWKYVPYTTVFTGILLFNYKNQAFKSADEAAFGALPLMLPHGDGARLLSVDIHGFTKNKDGARGDTPGITIKVIRTPYNSQITNSFELLIGSFFITHPQNDIQQRIIDLSISLDTTSGSNIVENSRYSYVLLAEASSLKFEATITGIVLNYQY